MQRRWGTGLGIALILCGAGCSQVPPRPEYLEVSRNLRLAGHGPLPTIRPGEPMATALDPPPVPPGLEGPQPVDVYIRRALAENRGVQAAWFRVQSMQDRIPQAVALVDPTVQNSVYPVPSYAVQTATGYVPNGLLIEQQFPWFGTLRLRGLVADKEVEIALFDLAAAELAVVERVKRAYFELYYNERAAHVLRDNRVLAKDVAEIAQVGYENGQRTRQDVLRAQVAIDELDNDLVRVRQGTAEARAMLARQLHISPEADLRTPPEVPLGDVPAEVERLYRLAIAARPELQARLAAIARDRDQVELARKKYCPDFGLGLVYQTVSAQNAVSKSANGHDALGLFVGFNVPIYRAKLDAAVREVENQAVSDARSYEDLRDQTYEEIKELFVQAQALREIIDLFHRSILPKSRQAFDVARNDYTTGRQDFVTLITAWQQVLTVQLQTVRLESDLGKALATLERVVGGQLGAHPAAAPLPPAPPPPAAPGPFQPALGRP